MSLKQYNFQPAEPKWLVRHHTYEILKTEYESLLKEKEELAQNLATKEEEISAKLSNKRGKEHKTSGAI